MRTFANYEHKLQKKGNLKEKKTQKLGRQEKERKKEGKGLTRKLTAPKTPRQKEKQAQGPRLYWESLRVKLWFESTAVQRMVRRSGASQGGLPPLAGYKVFQPL
eukprot:1157840-Pelagomonas_calceolata.AAC.2